MEYVKLGRTGLEVSRICLGCMSYGVPVGGIMPGASTRRSDIRRRGRERVSSSYPTTHRRAA
jgi:aryl-alcohol dehydrogenase-like predicted oxidoreductase